ncbi:MAG: YggS family pyridoxal phosphate-dependent enzyme [Vulcanimicrobiota bacterium]
MSIEDIRENISEVIKKIDLAAEKTGRVASDITLVAVSKTFPPGDVKTAGEAGLRHFGESYVQEGLDKIEELENQLDATWHFIGHLQKNKVRKVVQNFQVIQSVDSIDLMKRIERISREELKHLDVLLQVNLVGEESKSGMKPEEIEPVLDVCADFTHTHIKGLMLIPPFYQDPEKNRRNFSRLKQIFIEIDEKNYPNWESRYLSMGMTDDFEIAIEEGSNMVRVGRGIFGPRRRS